MAVPETVVPEPEPPAPVPATAITATPGEVATIIRYVSPIREIRDSGLLFTLQVPSEWNVSTWRLMNSDTSDYRTDLVAGNVFSVYTFPGRRTREQEYRDLFRQWIPAPVETMVTINGIRYERYESRGGGNTTVAYLARTESANERGYVSLLLFSARDSNPFELEDFENVVSSFRFMSGRSAATNPGDEIPLYDLSGKTIIRKATGREVLMSNSSDWDTAGGDFSGGDYSTESSSGGSSSGGGGCNR